MSGTHLTANERAQLRAALAAGSRLGASYLKLLDTDVYRERLGEEWFKYRGIIDAIMSNAIKEHLGEGDIFLRVRTGYVMFFQSKGEDEVRVVAEKVAREVSEQLSRDPAFRDPPIACTSHALAPANLLKLVDVELAGELTPNQPSRAQPDETSGLSYSALWHAKLERVIGCVCDTPQVETLVPVPLDKYYEESEELARRDIAFFNKALFDAFAMYKRRERALIVFSINFKSFCAPALHKTYMQALRQTPLIVAPFLMPRFVRIPPGAPGPLISAKSQLVAPIFRHVALHTPPEADLSRFQFAACSILATSWRDAARAARTGAAAGGDPTAVLAQFCKTGKSMRLNCLVAGVSDRLAFDAALDGGADFVAGDYVSPPSAKAVAQHRLALADIRGEGAGRRAEAVRGGLPV